MKTFTKLFIVIGILAASFISISHNTSNSETIPANVAVQQTIIEDGDTFKNDWIEGLMEFTDEDDTLDSLDYVPEFLR